MKKLIKFLFPKVYQEIINEGFEKGFNHEHEATFIFDDDYDCPEFNHNESDDLCYHDVSCELSLEVGDKIHLKSKLGIYTVKEVYLFHFVVSTAHNEFSVSNDDYKCHAGGNWNFKN
jgi:hypothetical protein